ncbi:MAG: hypothetical protein D6698_05125 [Gammaproteobacteria bacterium]|nr:MAG: hypothetical protein D6698_05125 [Gammaproteobacteria bacterium]
MLNRRYVIKALFGVMLPQVLFVSLAYAALNQNYPQDIATESPSRLLERSIWTGSVAEKKMIRRYLAEKFPDSYEGMFSKAAMAGYEGDAKSRITILKDCVRRYGAGAPACLGNLLAYADDTSRYLELAEQSLAQEPSIYGYWIFTNLGIEFKTAEDRRKFFNRWQGKVSPEAIDYIRAVELTRQRQYKEAASLLRQVLLSEDIGALLKADAYSRWLNLQLYHLMSSGLSARSKIEILIKPLVEVAKAELLKRGQHGSSERSRKVLAGMYESLAGKIESEFNAPRLALQILKMSPYPTVEQALSMARMLDSFDLGYQVDAAINVLVQGLERFPNQSQLEAAYANALFQNGNYDNHMAQAREYFQRSLKHAYTYKDQVETLKTYGKMAIASLHFEEMLRLLKSYMGNGHDDELLWEIYQNRRAAQDFRQALTYLDRYIANSKNRAELFKFERLDLLRYMNNEERLATYARNHPLLEQWERDFGQELKIHINFESGSSRIPPEDYAKLDRVANLLNSTSARDYIFSIVGHTDSVGSETMNQNLSLRRARAVARYFEHNHGISMNRLQIQGLGESYPIADNSKASGRAQNRRVAISPIAKAGEPLLALSGYLDSQARAVSPDGRYVVTGTLPAQLWDMENHVMIRSLGRVGISSFSPNGRYLATIVGYENPDGIKTWDILVYDTRSGLPIVQQPFWGGAGNVAWSPDSGHFIVGLGALSGAWVFDVRKKRPTRWINEWRHGDVIYSAWDKMNRYIFVGDHRGKHIYALNPNTFHIEKKIDVKGGWIFDLNLSGDGSLLAFRDNYEKLHLWDISRWVERQVVPGVLAPHVVPDSADYWLLMRDNSYVFLDAESGQMSPCPEVGRLLSKGMLIAPHSRTGYIFDEKSVSKYVLDDTSFTHAGRYEYKVSRAWESHAFRKLGLLAIFDQSGVNILDVSNGHVVHHWDASVDWVVQIPNGLVTTEAGHLYQYSLVDYTRRHLASLHFDVKGIDASTNLVVVGGSKNKASNELIVELYNLQTGERLGRYTAPLRTARLVYRDHTFWNGLTNLVLSPDKKQILFSTKWLDQSEMFYSKYLRAIDLRDGSIRDVVKVGRGITSFFLNESHPESPISLTVKGEEYRTHYYSLDGRHAGSSVAAKGETVREIGKWKLAYGASYLEVSGGSTGKQTLTFDRAIAAVDAFPDNNLMTILFEDNRIEFYDLSHFQKRLTVVLEDGGEWFAYNAAGYYASSLTGADHVYLAIGDVLHRIQDAAVDKNRPGLIAQELRAIATGKALVNASGAEVRFPSAKQAFLSPYRLELVTPKREEVTGSQYVMRLRVRMEKSDLPVPKVVYSQNGRVFNDRGISIKPVKESGNSFVLEQRFNLENGMNVLRAWVELPGVHISPVEAYIKKNAGVISAGTASPNTHLWYFGVGVSRYAKKEMNLDYADADAESLGRALKKQEGKLFRKVHVKVLTDESATARDIKIAMNKFLRQASSQDVIIIFLAGHGVQDSDQTLYFMPNDGDYEVPYTGMDVAEFNRFLRNRPRNQKALLWVDICHAGALGSKEWKTRGRLASEEVIQELSNGTGIGVLASSTGRESSLESAQFSGGHGAFTAGLLRALSGEADKETGNHDGVVSLLELQNFVSRIVPKLTDGRQHPTSPEMVNLRDFPIAVNF